MTPEQQISEINFDFSLANEAKFMNGQREHGGDFFAKPTVRNIREEAIDLVNYVHVLELHRTRLLGKIAELTGMIDTALPHGVAVKALVEDIKKDISNL